jgi:Protein of unknown function (DUF2423)
LYEAENLHLILGDRERYSITMAKGARASSRKRNNAVLRAKIFGPAHDARTERLSAKLQELVSKPKPAEERVMEVDSEGAEGKEQEIANQVNIVDGNGSNVWDARKTG